NTRRTFIMAVNVVENCIVWVIGSYRSMYRCLLGVTLHAVFELIKQIVGPVDKITAGITSFLHLDDMTSNSIQWTQTLNDTQAKIDAFFENDDTLIRQIIDKPFGLLQTQINTTFSAWNPPNFRLNSVSKNVSTLDLLQQPCSTNSLGESLENIEYQLTRYVYILIGVLFGLLLVCVLVHLSAIRFQQQQVAQARTTFLHLIRERHQKDHNKLLEEYTWYATTPFAYLIPWKKFKMPLNRLLMFMNHPVSVYCLLVGLCGLIMTWLLAWLLTSKSQQAYLEFQDQVQQWTLNTTSRWSTETQQQIDSMNTWINQTEHNLNNDAFGVIRYSAIALNGTLSNVVNQIQGIIHTVLGGTILEASAQQLAHCLLINKIEHVEQGLTWIIENTYIHLTRVDFSGTSSLSDKLLESSNNYFTLGETHSFGMVDQLHNLTRFYYMLIILWCIHLSIGLCFQIKYYFFQ
ncbi:plasma membrane fusion protein prm1, partial [Rhizopus stolonifer]